MAVRAAQLEVIVTADTSAAEKQLGEFANRVSGFLLGRMLKDLGSGLIDSFKGIVSTGAEFTQQMVFVDRVLGDTGTYMDALTAKALQMGQQTIYSAQQAAQGMEQLAREGFSAQQIIGSPGGHDGLIDSALNLAAALNEDVQTAANQLGNTIRVFSDQNLTAAQTSDILTQAILRSGREATQFFQAFQYVGGLADTLHVPLGEIATDLAYLEAHGIQARNAGTSLRTMLTNLLAPTAAAADEIAFLGLQTTNSQGNFVGMDSIIGQLHESFKGLNDAQKAQAVTALFGKYATGAMLELIAAGPGQLDKFKQSEEQLGSTQDIMNARVNTLAGSMHKLESSIFTLKKVMGDAVGGAVKPFVDAAVALVNALITLPTPVLAAVSTLMLLAGVLLQIAGTRLIFNALGGWGIFVAGLEAVGTTALVVVGALGLLAGAVAGVAVLWNANAFGIQDKVLPAWGRFLDFAQRTKVQFDTLRLTGMNPVSAAFYAMADALTPLVGDGTGGIGTGGGGGRLPALLRNLGGLSDYFLKVAQTGKAHNALLDQLSGGWRTAALSLGSLVRGAREFGQDIANGDLSKAFDDLGRNVSKAFGTLDIDWSAVASTAWDLFTQAVELAARGGIKLGKIALSVAGWVVGKIPDLYTWLHNKILGWVYGGAFKNTGDGTEQNPGGGAAAHDLGDVAVKIGGWAISAAEDIYGAISAWIRDHVSFVGGGGIPKGAAVPLGGGAAAPGAQGDIVFHGWKVTIGAPNGITLDYGAVFGAIWQKLNAPLTVSDDTAHDWDATGHRWGLAVGKKLFDGLLAGIKAFFAGGGGGGGDATTAGGAGQTDVVGALSSAAAEAVKGIAQGFGREFIKQLNGTEFGKELQNASGDPVALGLIFLDVLIGIVDKALDAVKGSALVKWDVNLGHKLSDLTGGKGSWQRVITTFIDDLTAQEIDVTLSVDGLMSRVMNSLTNGIGSWFDSHFTFWQGTLAQRLYQGLVGILSGGKNAAGGAFGQVGDTISGAAQGVADNALTQALYDAIVQPVIDALNGLGGLFDTALATVANPFDGITDTISGWINDALGSLGSLPGLGTLRDLYDAIKSGDVGRVFGILLGGGSGGDKPSSAPSAHPPGTVLNPGAIPGYGGSSAMPQGVTIGPDGTIGLPVLPSIVNPFAPAMPLGVDPATGLPSSGMPGALPPSGPPPPPVFATTSFDTSASDAAAVAGVTQLPNVGTGSSLSGGAGAPGQAPNPQPFLDFVARVKAAMTQVPQVVATALTQARTQGTAAVTAFVAAVSAQFAQLQARIRTVLAPLPTTVAAVFGAVRSQGAALAAATVQAVGSQMATLPGRVAAALAPLPGIVASYQGPMYAAGYGLGFQAGAGVAAGIDASMVAVEIAAAGLAVAVAAAVALKAEIASPSRVMMRLGKQMADGLVLGLAQGRDDVARASEAMTRLPATYRWTPATAGHTTVVHFHPGSYAGPGTVREIKQLAARGSAKVVDHRTTALAFADR